MQPATEPTRRNPEPSAITGRGSASCAAVPGRTASSPALLTEPFLIHAPRSRRTALLLCLFLGWAGCHRYYVGKRRTGRLYLLTSGLLLLGVLVDLICILAGCFHDGSGRPLE
jgi:restriction system protein